MGVVNDAVRGRTLKIECSGLSINFLSTLNTLHSTFVRPPRGRVEIRAVSPPSRAPPRLRLHGVKAPEPPPLLFQRQALFLQNYVKCLRINAIQLNPDFLAATNNCNTAL